MVTKRLHLAIGAFAVVLATPAIAWAHGVPSAEAERLANGSVLDCPPSAPLRQIG